MSTTKNKGPIIDPGICRCCGSLKKCRYLNYEYKWFGEKEIYSEMMMECFGLLLSHLDGKPTDRLVCATCVQRLREAVKFRQQVIKCEEAFLKAKYFDSDARDNEIKLDSQPLSPVQKLKAEPEDNLDIDIHDAMSPDNLPDNDSQSNIKLESMDDSNSDDIPLKKMQLNTPIDINVEPLTIKVKAEKSLKGNVAVMPLKRRTEVPLKKVSMVKRPMASKPAPVMDTKTMSHLQQRMRERDPSYITEINILTVIENSYVCPFKCRHNYLLCHYCGQHFTDPQVLREHNLLHNPKKFKISAHKKMLKVELTRIDCRLCNEKIDSLDKFRQHITMVHNKKYYFAQKDMLLPFKFTKDNIKCALCEASFSYFHALNRHMNEHYSNYVCETCGLGFVDKGRFMMHQQRHETSDFPCETCGKVFKAPYNRDLHIDRVHNKKGRVYCPKCDVMLMTYPQKLKHLVEVHGEAPLSFPCNLCEKVFDARRMLTIHKRKDHFKDFRYECQCCGQKFFTRFALTNHMPVHTGERNFKCKVCGKSYPRLKTLKYHIRIHTNDRRYRCHICGQAFIQNCSLKGHMKSQHPEYS